VGGEGNVPEFYLQGYLSVRQHGCDSDYYWYWHCYYGYYYQYDYNVCYYHLLLATEPDEESAGPDVA
jgi:hypothetical protein